MCPSYAIMYSAKCVKKQERERYGEDFDVDLAKNEERNMADCIASVAFSDEILVIDDFSTDRTKEIAESLGAVSSSGR